MKCTVILTEDAKNDFKALPLMLKQECYTMLEKLEDNINMGKPLYYKNGKDLRGLRKIYFYNAQYRIIYRKIGVDQEVVAIEKAEVVGIGERDNETIYSVVATRLRKNDADIEEKNSKEEYEYDL